MAPVTATTVAAWPLAVLDTLERRGLDGNLALREAGLERAWLAANPGGRVTVAAMGRLWAAAERLSGDPAIGLYVGLAAQPMHLRILGLLVQTAPSLDQVIDFAVRFQALVSNSVTVSRVHRPGAEGLAIRPLDGTPVHPCALDAFIAAHVHHLVRVAPARA
ncbi:MAG: AraC family transcriptional regulator ligand-binding domain-containing protein, partial [Alloalcanivorax venustensis]|uniref:AraC family transcriptional regulator ligand-binding domain-containing protein n=1 Tax=Alloalcanivorax venustensis TaxID=172371 RepID=UPI0032988474